MRTQEVYMPEANFTKMDLAFIPTCIRNHMPNKMRDEITYPFPNFNSCTVEVWHV